MDKIGKLTKVLELRKQMNIFGYVTKRWLSGHMKPQHFLLREFVREAEAFHLARVTIHSMQDLSLHRHDFAEIFWVESGEGLHLINNKQTALRPGHVVMMRPDDEHTFTATKGGITIMNLAFPVETLDHFKRRYFPDSSSYFWTTNELPYFTWLGIPMIYRISQKAEGAGSHKSHFHLDSLLLFIFGLIAVGEERGGDRQVPSWLHHAMLEFSTPGLFKRGAPGFAHICGRNMDHVNRVVRKVFNKTLSDLITESRMSFAAKQLSTTNVPIKSICHDCGFINLGHFYKTFKDMFHQTPAEYREINQTIV